MDARLRRTPAVVLVAALYLVLAAPSADAAGCTSLTRLLGCTDAPSSSGGTTSGTTQESCTALSRLLGCKTAPAPGGGTTPTGTVTTCTALQQLFGCRPSGGTPPPQPPGVRPDGSLDVTGNDGGLKPLPPHDPLAVPAAPLFPRTAAGRLPYGFNGWRTNVPMRQLARLSAYAGTKIVRVAMHWAAVEYKRSTWGWAKFDELYREHVLRGVRPLWVLVNTPRAYVDGRNANTGTCGGTILSVGWDCKAPPAMSRLGHLEDFARRVAVRYPLAAGIEVWNEPNLKRYWRPGPDPARYATVVRAVWDGIHRPAKADGTGGRPEMRVLAGATNNAATTTSDATSDKAFLSAAFGAGMGRTMDGLSYHVFPYQADSARWAEGHARVQQVLAEQPDAYVSGMRLALTETGLSTGVSTDVSAHHSEQAQADGLARLYGEADRGVVGGGRIDLVGVHTLEDYGPQGLEEGFGALRARLADGRWPAKLAWCRLRSEAGGITGPVPAEIILSPQTAAACGAGG